jgi:ferredoxin-NADP reductase
MATLKLIRKTHLTDNVYNFEFEAHPDFSWKPGQFMRVELPHREPDKEGTKRWFTISAAPFEKHPAISTRITTSTFKQALANVPLDGELQLLATPDGDFLWEETDRPLVFVAAGIGITPFRSILMQRAHDGQPLKVTLVYGNRTEDAPFKAELDALAADHPDFKIHYVTGGLLTAGRLTELLPNLMNCLVYISGPEPMVEALGDGLRSAGLPEPQIKQDFFPNYTEANY